jgi:hypothetical protein
MKSDKKEPVGTGIFGETPKFTRQLIDQAKLPQQVVEKWSSSVLSEGFVPFPKKLLRSMHRIFTGSDSMLELSVVLAIVDFRRPNVTRPPSLDYLAFLAGLDPVEFQKVLVQLESKGYIQVAGGPAGLEITLEGLLQKVEGETR